MEARAKPPTVDGTGFEFHAHHHPYEVAAGLKTPLVVLTDEAHRIAEQGLPNSAATILDQCRKLQTHIDYQTTRAGRRNAAVARRIGGGADGGRRDRGGDDEASSRPHSYFHE